MFTMPADLHGIKVVGINPAWEQRAMFSAEFRAYSVQAYSVEAGKWYHVKWVKPAEVDKVIMFAEDEG